MQPSGYYPVDQFRSPIPNRSAIIAYIFANSKHQLSYHPFTIVVFYCFLRK